jgi:uncharacterized protein
VPDPDGPATTRVLVAFARNLRHAGLAVPVDNVVQFLRAVAAMGVDREPLYWAGRTVLVHRSEDLETYDRVFESFWRGASSWPHHGPPSVERRVGDQDEDDSSPEDGSAHQLERVTYSETELLRRKDFAACTPEEFSEILRLLGATHRGPVQPSRRTAPTARCHGRHDARATMRKTLRSGGEMVTLIHCEHTMRPRRIVLLCDVSGSMEPYARAMLRFLHIAVVGRRRVEAFAVGTRLTRLTRQLSSHDPDAAMSKAIEKVPDWSGGTRLGDGIGSFNDRYGMPGMARGAVVVILSDGLDRGDPLRLSGEMARLQRAARQTIWVNPLKATAGYEPLARGMVAALPYVDRFVEGHSAASLDALMGVIADCA